MKKHMMLSVLLIPLNFQGEWKRLEYSGIAKHEIVNYSSSGLKVRVNNSAMPLIYPLKSPKQIKALTVKGKALSLPKLDSSIQGSKGNDDYVLRVGLVLKGSKKLSWLKRKFSPSWVKTLFNLAPKGVGIDKIEFYNLYQDKRLRGVSKTHPKAKGLMIEHNIAYISTSGEFILHKSFDTEREVLAIWLSIDGDDTKSQFSVEISEIKLRL